MSSKSMTRYTSAELRELQQQGKSQTRWEEMQAKQDEDIDYTDAPELSRKDYEQGVVRKAKTRSVPKQIPV
ncbi:MAG: hypothetical protein OSB18_01815 [SAR324 cluster bacterium]|nr:hypothetical protein [SAR324 cluster bacterium]